MRFGTRWNSFWFRPTSPDNLGFCRIIFYGGILLYYLFANSEGHIGGGDFGAWARVSRVFWDPIRLFARLPIPLFSPEVLVALQAMWKLALGLSCIGLFTRLSTTISFILGLYLLGLPQNFGETHHQDAIVVFAFLIMAFSQCGKSWSVDQLVRTARHRDEEPGTPALDGENTWPIRLIWALISLVFFAAGVSKMRYSGLAWITSANMEILLMNVQYHTADADPLTSWGLNLARTGWLPHFMAGGTVVLELGYPIGLFSREARWLLVPASLLMLLGIAVVVGPRFYPLALCQLFWVPWDRVAARLGLPDSRLGRPGHRKSGMRASLVEPQRGEQ